MLLMLARGRGEFGHLVGSLVLLVISSVIALGLAEYIFRAVKEMRWRNSAESWQHELFSLLPDSPLEYQLYPGVTRENQIPDTGKTWRYRINSEGFRGDNFDPGDNRKRVLFIGDSYTFGWAVDEDEVLTEAVERVLVEPLYEPLIDALNLGMPGYNTVQEYHLLNQVVDRYGPDLVVLGYVMNDGEPQRIVLERPSVRYKYVTSWLLSYIKEQINYYIYEGEPVLNTGVNIGTDFLLAAQENGPKWAEGRQAFADMVELCNSRKIPFMVVIYPDYTQPFDQRYPYRIIHEEVITWADEQGVLAVDMLPYMKNKDHKNYMVKGDGHPNGRAFTEAAQIIAPVIYQYFEDSAP
jgi:lysophospholipase L1-like esterase